MKPPQAVINQAINDVLVKWAVDFIDRRRSDASQKLEQASGKGLQSFEQGIIKAEGARIAEALFAFNAYLRTFDFKRLEWDRIPNVDAIEKWVVKKGADKFVNKYLAKHPRKFPIRAKIINQIAWGISISKYKKLRKRKRKQWYSKNYNKGVSALYPLLMDALSKESLDNLVKELK